MPSLDAPSPTPSNITSTAGIKRPRPSANPVAAGPSRTKRRKPEDGIDDDVPSRSKQPVNFGVGMVKGKEDEWGEPADVSTKVTCSFRFPTYFVSPRATHAEQVDRFQYPSRRDIVQVLGVSRPLTPLGRVAMV
jgi:hypothetical protein